MRSGSWESSIAHASESPSAWPRTARTTRPMPAMTTFRQRTRPKRKRWAISWARKHLRSSRSECKTPESRARKFHQRFQRHSNGHTSWTQFIQDRWLSPHLNFQAKNSKRFKSKCSFWNSLSCILLIWPNALHFPLGTESGGLFTKRCSKLDQTYPI